jgi:hypothetical protein
VTPQQTFSAEAEAAAQRYGLLVEAWRGLYNQALDAPDFGTQRQIEAIVAQAYEIARTFRNSEEDHIALVSTQIAERARRETLDALASTDTRELTDAASEHLGDAESYLLHEIAIQVERDIAFLKQSLRRTYLQVALAARSRDLPTRTALLQYRIGNATELHFFFHDRGNQKWPSRKFIRGVWRHHLLSLWNEVVLLTLSDHGLEEADIAHANPGSHVHGMRIAMASNSKWPTYAEIRNEVFHPNSDALVVPAGD